MVFWDTSGNSSESSLEQIFLNVFLSFIQFLTGRTVSFVFVLKFDAFLDILDHNLKSPHKWIQFDLIN